MPWPLLAAAGIGVTGYAGYMLWMVAAPASARARRRCSVPCRTTSPSIRALRAQCKRVKVMADYHCHPLWALDEDIYGDFAPDELGLSPSSTPTSTPGPTPTPPRSIADDPATSLWSEQEHKAHAAQARPLAVRLARERPDLMVYVLEGDTGVVQVHADESAD